MSRRLPISLKAPTVRRPRSYYRYYFTKLDADDNESAVYSDADPWGPCYCPACNSKTRTHQWPALRVVS